MKRLLLSVLLGAASAHAVDYYVAPGGNDNAAGSSKTLFFTARTSVYSLRVKIPGLPGHPFRRG